VGRMNFAVALSSNRVGGTYVDWSALLGQPEVQQSTMVASTDPAAKEARLEALLLGQPASEQTRTTVIKEIDGQTAQQQAEKQFGIQSRDAEPMWAVLNAAAPRGPARPQLDRDAAMMAGLLMGSPEFQRR